METMGWETMGHGIHEDITSICTTDLKIVADHVQSLMATVFPDGSGLFQRDDVPCNTAKKMFRNG